ncbi:MAG TPA: ABC transporter ATP-binding protein, partial [Firmicutes bacterium]|nr:ABC transporter ATP-binding protein [Bacillota bacterium]
MDTLEIINLHVSVKNKEILKGISLKTNSNETIALLGPNGNGKSTLLQSIMGNPNYKVTSGQILFNGKDISNLDVD